MRVNRCGRLLAILGIASLLASLPALDAEAASRRAARQAPSAGLQCVPFARQVSGIDITGNAHTWWRQAEGRYQRSATPEPGAVLVFRASGGMRLGHVSVVTKVVSPRHILVDHANWSGPGFSKGRVARGVSMIDVSEGNTWTSVRVEIHGNNRDGFGRHYATYGFILPRTADGDSPPPLSPLTEARARLDARAAHAAARPAGYVGRAAQLADEIAAEIGDREPSPRVAQSVPAQSTAAQSTAAQSTAARSWPTTGDASPVRVAMFEPRQSLVDDVQFFAAPNRSLR